MRAEAGEVTLSVVALLAPGANESEAAVNVPDQAAGTAEVRVKVEAVQGLTSLLVTERAKETVVPADTVDVCDGARVTAGATCVQDGGGGLLTT